MQLLVPSAALRVYASMHYIGYILIFGTFFLVRFVLPSPPRTASSAHAKPLGFSKSSSDALATKASADPKAKMVR